MATTFNKKNERERAAANASESNTDEGRGEIFNIVADVEDPISSSIMFPGGGNSADECGAWKRNRVTVTDVLSNEGAEELERAHNNNLNMITT